MTQQIINTGTADKGNGDPIRTAFTKVNANFTELYNQSLLAGVGVVVDTVPPEDPEEGALWWDPEGGRMYVYYGTSWVDSNPVDGVGDNSYSPTTDSDWSGTPPTTTTEAIDRLATLVKALNNGVGA
jgi:hypothetical protein